MRRVFITGIASLLTIHTVFASATPQQPSAPGPPIPFIDQGACPFEGCVYREWTANADVPVRRSRSRDTTVVFNVRRGEKITAVTGVVITVRPGRVTFKEPQEFQTGRGPLRVAPGESLYLFTYHGEGFYTVWHRGRIYRSVDVSRVPGLGCFKGCAGTLMEPWKSEWWIQIKNASGQIGWTDAPDKFDGKDAFGDFNARAGPSEHVPDFRRRAHPFIVNFHGERFTA